MNKKKYIAVFGVFIVLVALAVSIYLFQLYKTVNSNLMSTVDEISSHDVVTIEKSLDDMYGRLNSIASRVEAHDAHSVADIQDLLNVEAQSSLTFNAIYLMEDTGRLYGSSYLTLEGSEHAYDERFRNDADHFVMLYDVAEGQLETTVDSLIFGVKLDDVKIAGFTFTAMLGRSDVAAISDLLMVDDFDGEGSSSVVNTKGNYVVRGSTTAEVIGVGSFYEVLEAGRLEDGMTVEQVKQNLLDGVNFVVNFDSPLGDRLVLSFTPIGGTEWSFIMAVPTSVFEQHFAPFVTMTIVMLVVMLIVLFVMLVIIYTFMKRSVLAKAEAQTRSEFLSNMSHEIRTPLNGIIGLNHLMANHLDDRQAMGMYVKKLGNAAKYLLSLVNDILDVSKLQAGKIDLQETPFDLQVTVDNVCDMQQETMEERSLNFDTSSQDIPYPYLLGDEVRISQILMNVLSNASKFTPAKGDVMFKVTQRLSPYGDSVLTSFTVADTGCGMTPEFCEHIFETFTQERNSNSDSQKGTGLGMSITKLLVDEMRGNISVDSELGIGSVFKISIPLRLDPEHKDEMPLSASAPQRRASRIGTQKSDATESMPKRPIAPEKDGDKKRILIAEDNDLNAEILYSILSEEGYDVTVATNGEEAIEAFEASEVGEYMAILMDVQMPVVDGYEASREIRKMGREDAQSVTIYACTASTFADDRDWALKCGMNDFLAKPLNVPDMLRKLKALEESLS